MEKKTFVTKEQIEEIVKTYPTPFHLYDEKGIRENVKALKEAFAWNPGSREYFAVKATPNPFIIDILKEYGCGCDCSSMTELMLSHDALAVKGDDIMFSSNDTPAAGVRLRGKNWAPSLTWMTITHIDFLEKTLGYIPETISCRLQSGRNLPDQQRYHGQPRRRQVRHDRGADYSMLTGYCKQKGAKHFGIHAFLASNTVTNDYYPMLAKVLFELAVRLKKETGADIRFINLSGGVGIPYRYYGKQRE